VAERGARHSGEEDPHKPRHLCRRVVFKAKRAALLSADRAVCVCVCVCVMCV
jgi:hypothetical protein